MRYRLLEHGLGNQDFLHRRCVVTVPATPGGPAFPLRRRMPLAMLLGLIVVLISLLASWQKYRRDFTLDDPQVMTWWHLATLRQAIVDHRDEHGTPPTVLEELAGVEELDWSRLYWGGTRSAPSGVGALPAVFEDWWRRRILYRTHGDQWELGSLGRDGKLGGSGMDSDLFNPLNRPENGAASFVEFLTEQPSGGLVASAVAAGFLAFFLALLLIRTPLLTPLLGLGLAAVLVGTVATTVALGWLHIPFVSGH